MVLPPPPEPTMDTMVASFVDKPVRLNTVDVDDWSRPTRAAEAEAGGTGVAAPLRAAACTWVGGKGGGRRAGQAVGVRETVRGPILTHITYHVTSHNIL